MTELADVLVIGAGPAGSAAALSCARRDVGRVVVIDRQDFPRRKVCASGLSPRARKALRRLGLWARVEPEVYSIRGLRLVSPNGRSCVLAGADSASVLARSRFDQILLEAAVEAGAQFEPGVRATGLIFENERVVGVQTDRGDIEARWVVNAGGANVRLAPERSPRRILQTCMAWFEGVEFTPHILEMVFDPAILPHYGWLFPESEGRVNFGMCVDAERRPGSIRRVFEEFLDRYYGERLRGAEQVGGFRGHPISVSTRVEIDAPVGLLPVGEAARLVNIATGEGISYALESGDLAAEAIGRGSYGGVSAAGVSRWYREACRRRFRSGLYGGELFRRHGYKSLNAITRLGGSWLVRRATNQAMVALTG